ncbi:MAG: sirohydrochlorin chelatase [Frankiales bacterium]|nr:sirohydrochlorin chelatase [Frankiales bacterium]
MTVLLGVAHGSRDEAAQQVVRTLLDAAGERLGVLALPAYIDNASPSIALALEGLAAAGHDDVVVLPLLLNAAGHSKTDVAASVQQARLDHPGMRLHYGRPFGAHPSVVGVLEQRLVEAGATDRPVVLVAGGSLDPDANATVAATARLLWEGRAHPTVDYAFVSATGPSVEQALTRSPDAVVSLLFLGPGYLPTKATKAAGDRLVTAPLGAAPPLVDLVVERYREALGDDVRMNCDACLYRIALPGRESAVGAPQLPHTHPDDA